MVSTLTARWHLNVEAQPLFVWEELQFIFVCVGIWGRGEGGLSRYQGRLEVTFKMVNLVYSNRINFCFSVSKMSCFLSDAFRGVDELQALEPMTRVACTDGRNVVACVHCDICMHSVSLIPCCLRMRRRNKVGLGSPSSNPCQPLSDVQKN